MGLSQAISRLILESLRENEETTYSKIHVKIRPVLLAFHEGIHRVKEIVAIHRQPKGRDWTELPPELLHLISKKFEDASNIIRFRSVCKKWRSAVDAIDAPPQLPLFMWPTFPLTERCIGTVEQNDEYFLYSLTSNATGKIRFDEPFLRRLFTGFALCFEYPSFPLFLSPFAETTTRKRRNTLLHRITCFHCNSNLDPRTRTTSCYYVTNKLTPQGKTIKISYGGKEQPWRTIKNVSIRFPSGPVVIGHYKGRLFLSLSVQRVTWMYDARTGIKSSVEIPHPNEYANFDFMIDVMGDFLAVMQFDVGEMVPPYGKDIKHVFDVYQLEHTPDFGHCRWSKLNVVGNEIFSCRNVLCFLNNV